ncbi:MAG: hypothetical protein ACK5O2_13900 [Microthrixaceae bacterium]
MSGEIRLNVPADSVIARSVRALARFPTDVPWVLIGGIAVFIRLGSVTRATADADTVARSQTQLLDRLVAEDPTILVANGDVTVPVDGVDVEVDVMDLADEPLPHDPERRAFALARGLALNSATTEAVSVTDTTGGIVAEATLPIATIPALVALKTVSMVRRPNSNHPEKVGSDIHDLVRLVDAVGARSIGETIAAEAPGLASWVTDQIERAFGKDLRYTLVRLRRNDRSAAAQALSDDTVGAVSILADVLHDELTA